jgi:UDP-N-acetylglucosamine--N-acetylmuramyl-(pentapeptide) pyrophosphoryl-undecaprenol N-acetylglucosamine transferase
MTPNNTILLVGGGTGGHVFPLIAVADELRILAPKLRLVFVGTERGLESQVVPERGYELRLVHIEPIRGRGVFGALRGVRAAAGSIPEAVALLREFTPKVVFSIGGYAAGSLSVASQLLRVPLALMEPNSVIGLANRLVAPFVARAYTQFPSVERHFPAAAVMRAGLAIRRGFEPCDYDYDGKKLRVLVLGGSQGAVALNQTVPRALSAARTPLTVVHQAGKGHDGAVRTLYSELGAGHQVNVVPFISDMPAALREADLVIGRSGAGASAEICAVGRPALFVPYPYAAGDHQFKNAESLARSGAAAVVRAADASVERLASEVDRLAANPERLRSMAEAAQQLGRPDAAEQVAEDLLRLGNIRQMPDDDEDQPIPTVRSMRSLEVH